MKHLRSLFEMSNRKLTISFLLASIILIVASQQIGIADNLPGIAALWGGMICLFFAILHPWRRSGNYGILAGVSFGCILLTLLIIFIFSLLKKTEYLSEAVVFAFVGLFCIPGILVGFIGAIYWSFRKNN
jgi:succinate-acetate transporter protein